MRLDLSTIGFSVLASGIFGCQNSSETTVATPQWIQANACNMDTIRREHPPYRVVVEGDDVRTTPYTETISTDRDPSVAGIQSLQEANKNLPFLFCVDANSQQGNHFATYGFSSARRNFYLGNLPHHPPLALPQLTHLLMV
ncbi:MAG: hypothetical protein IPJ69_06235 [Deltaproteobacteria bacterium]|nr:MAG: hypothetical protein IPJ69_06235 [Deltaproteobacteria bacterium]